MRLDAEAVVADAYSEILWRRRKNLIIDVFMFSAENENNEFLLLPVNVYRYQRPQGWPYSFDVLAADDYYDARSFFNSVIVIIIELLGPLL